MYSSVTKALILPNGRTISNFDNARTSCSAPVHGRTRLDHQKFICAVPQANVSLAVYQRLKRLGGHEDNSGLNTRTGKEIRSSSAQVRTKPERIGSMDYQNNQHTERNYSGSRGRYGSSNCFSDNKSVNTRAISCHSRPSMYAQNGEHNGSIRDTLPPVLGGRQAVRGLGLNRRDSISEDGLKHSVKTTDQDVDEDSDMFSFHGPEVLTHKLKIEKLKDLQADKQVINVKTISFAPGTKLESPTDPPKNRLLTYNYGGQGPRFNTPRATHLVGSGQEAAKINRLKSIHDRHSRKAGAQASRRNISAAAPAGHHGREPKPGPSWIYRSKTTIDLTKYRDRALNRGLMEAMNQTTNQNHKTATDNVDEKLEIVAEETFGHRKQELKFEPDLLDNFTVLPTGIGAGGVFGTHVTSDSGVASENSDKIGLFTENDVEDKLEKFERRRFPPGGSYKDRNVRQAPSDDTPRMLNVRDINDGIYVGNNHEFTNSVYSKGLGRTVAANRGSINRPHSPPGLCLAERHLQELRTDRTKPTLQRNHTLADFDKQRSRTYDLQTRVKSFLNKS